MGELINLLEWKERKAEERFFNYLPAIKIKHAGYRLYYVLAVYPPQSGKNKTTSSLKSLRKILAKVSTRTEAETLAEIFRRQYNH